MNLLNKIIHTIKHIQPSIFKRCKTSTLTVNGTLHYNHVTQMARVPPSSKLSPKYIKILKSQTD